MTSTTFVDQQTVILASWLNDVNALVYTIFNGLATVPSAGKIFRSSGTNIVPSTFTIPDTFTQYDLIYASATNTLTALAKANTGVLVTDGSGVPSWDTGGLNIDHGGTGAITAATARANIFDPIFTTKGDLVAATGNAAAARVGVGNNGQALIADSSQTAGVAWGLPVIFNYLSGLTMSTAGGSGTMAISAGQACDSTNIGMMTLASAISKGTGSWAVGTGNGGIDSGSIANSTWYHFYLIKRVDTGVVDVLFSTSASAPAMPANYTLKRRIGSGKTDGAAHWVLFVQDGDLFQWSASVLDIDVTNPGTAAVTRTLASVPTGIHVIAMFNYGTYDPTNANQIFPYFSDLDVSDEAPSATAAPLSTGISTASNSNGGTNYRQIRTNTSAQIRSRMNATSATSVVKIATLGWIDRRGKDG